MGFSVMLWGAEKLVPAEYWCPYGTSIMCFIDVSNYHAKLVSIIKHVDFWQASIYT